MILSFPLMPVQNKKKEFKTQNDNAFKILLRIMKIMWGDKNT